MAVTAAEGTAAAGGLVEALWSQLPPAPGAAVAGATLADPVGPRKVAVFVNNRANPKYNDLVQALEDKVIASLASADFAPFIKDDTVQAMNQFPEAARPAGDRNALGTQADRLLADQSTALRLARNMGADFLLIVNLSSLTATVKDLAAAGMQGSLREYKLDLNCAIKEGVTGGALTGGTFSLKKPVRYTGAAPEEDPAVFEELLDEGAQKVAAKLLEDAAKIKEQPLPATVEILIAAAPRDVQGNEISLPDLRVKEDNTVVSAGAALPVQVAATVEIDGMAMGTTPVRLRVAPGMHKVRLSRSGFEDVNLTINATDRLTLFPAMTLTAEAFQRWQQIRAFLLALDVTKELTAAQAEALRGYAQMLRQSGYRVDTTAAPTVIVKKSVYSIE